MDKDFDIEEIIDKMRELRNRRDLEILENQVNEMNLNTSNSKNISKNKVINVKYLGTIDDIGEKNNGRTTKKEIYQVIEQREKDGKLIEVKRYYTEDGEMLGGNNTSDNYNYVILNEKYSNNQKLQEELQGLNEKGIIDLNKIERERFVKIAKVLEIDSKDIDKLAEINEKDIEEANNKIEKEESNKQNKKILDKKEVEKISTKTEINTNQKVTDKDTISSLLKVEGRGYKKIAVIYSDKLQEDRNTTKFSFVGIKEDGSAEKIDSLEQGYGKTPTKKVNSLNRDGSEIEEKQMNSIYKIKGEGEKQLAINIGSMGVIETSLVRTPKQDNEEAISIPIETQSIRPTTREIRELMNEQRNPRVKEEINRIKEHQQENCEPSIKDIDDNLYNDTHTHVETIDKAYIDGCVKEILNNDIVASNYGRDYVQKKVIQKLQNNEVLSKDEIVKDLTGQLVEDSEYEHEEIEHEHEKG